jgi:hypothetical protein
MKLSALASLVLAVGLASPSLAQNVRWNELANLPFQQDYPTEETAQRLMDELLFERGMQSYLWALPAVNMWAMKQGSEAQFGAGYNVLPVWKQRLSAKTLVTTPNSDVIYAMGYVDLGKDGPSSICRRDSRASSTISGNSQYPVRPSMAILLPATLASPVRIEAKAENTCSFRPATRARCPPTVISCTVRSLTTS